MKRDWRLSVSKNCVEVNSVEGPRSDPATVTIFSSTYDKDDKRRVVSDGVLIAGAPALLEKAKKLLKKLEELGWSQKIGVSGEVYRLAEAVARAEEKNPRED